MTKRRWCSALSCAGALTLIWSAGVAHAQTGPAAAPPPPQAQAAVDALGRDTPRGTVIGFLTAARRDEDEIAREFLNTRSSAADARVLAHQLFVVLDARLPARLSRLSDVPEGSRSNPLRPDQEVVGTISTAGGDIDVIVERVSQGTGAPIWLFSPTTLEAIPSVFEEVTVGWGERLPRFLTSARVGGVRLFEWVAVLLGLPFFYLLTLLLNKILTGPGRALWSRLAGRENRVDSDVLPTPIRLLILALAIRWFLSSLPLPLLVRQFWSNLAALFTIAWIVWLLISLNGVIERYVQRRFPRARLAAAATLVRVLRRGVDLLVIFLGLLAMLRHFGIDPTPALAGLGVGGIALALAAQKTLENVIAGASLIFDQAVRVGDFLKMGEIQGTVEHIGLRSTRIRTLERTMVSVPNGQIANMSLETLSVRDKFWFHPIVSVRYETTPQQLREVVDGIRRLLEEHASVDRDSVRVRFIRLGEFSLDIEVFAYVYASDWSRFLEIQERLLFGVTDVVETAGTQIAFRSRTMYLADPPIASGLPGSRPPR